MLVLGDGDLLFCRGMLVVMGAGQPMALWLLWGCPRGVGSLLVHVVAVAAVVRALRLRSPLIAVCLSVALLKGDGDAAWKRDSVIWCLRLPCAQRAAPCLVYAACGLCVISADSS